MTRPGLAVAVLLAAGLPGAQALEVLSLEAGERGRSYFVEFEAHLAAPPAAVMRVLQDYPGYPALDRRIGKAHIVGTEAGRPVLHTRLRGCVGSLFCRTMDRYEQLTETDGLLVAEALPGRGDLAAGRSETRVEPDGDGARVSYSTWFEPAFWMPRWLVRDAMRRTLEEGTRAMFENVEARAREAAP